MRDAPVAESQPASENHRLGGRGRQHHALRSVWTHNVWPARKTGCHALGLKAVKTPVTGCEDAGSCPRCSQVPGGELQIRQKKIEQE